MVIASIKSWKTKKRDFKFGIELPRTIKCALEINHETNMTFWRDTIAKEMKHDKPTFEILMVLEVQ